MLRQRLRAHSSPATLVARLLVILLALALVWYGAMTIVLAAKGSPQTVNQISAYRTIYDFLAGLQPSDITGLTRILIAAIGVVVFLVFGSLAIKTPPRPYLARRDLAIGEAERGSSVIEPRAIERMAELAAGESEAVTSARGRYAPDELGIDVAVAEPERIADTLTDVRGRVIRALARHDLPHQPVAVTFIGLDDQPERKLA